MFDFRVKNCTNGGGCGEMDSLTEVYVCSQPKRRWTKLKWKPRTKVIVECRWRDNEPMKYVHIQHFYVQTHARTHVFAAMEFIFSFFRVSHSLAEMFFYYYFHSNAYRKLCCCCCLCVYLYFILRVHLILLCIEVLAAALFLFLFCSVIVFIWGHDRTCTHKLRRNKCSMNEKWMSRVHTGVVAFAVVAAVEWTEKRRKKKSRNVQWTNSSWCRIEWAFLLITL